MFILVVDRNEGIRRVARTLLETAGHIVKTTSSSAEAMKLCPIADVVISELFVPDYDGLTFLHFFKSKFPELKIIAMSDGKDISELELFREVKELGATALKKPFSQAQLLGTIARTEFVETAVSHG